MVHTSWLPHNGFQGRPVDMIRVLQAAVGTQGLVVMPSLTYQNESSKEFLARGVTVDIRRSPSQMGLLTEVFRRGKAVRRSLNPTHPLLAWGAQAEWFLAGHELALEPFGCSSPFARLLELNGKILAIDAPFSSITFTHFLEDRIAPMLPFALYEPAPLTGIVVDYEGRRREIPVRVLSDAANRFRREERLVAALEKARVLRRARLGNTRLLLVECQAMTQCVDRMLANGESLFDNSP
ncbi:MAG: AAC(3) family N-acetyltransferase [Candidatus Competibacteraceae bacterium]